MVTVYSDLHVCKHAHFCMLYKVCHDVCSLLQVFHWCLNVHCRTWWMSGLERSNMFYIKLCKVFFSFGNVLLLLAVYSFSWIEELEKCLNMETFSNWDAEVYKSYWYKYHFNDTTINYNNLVGNTIPGIWWKLSGTISSIFDIWFVYCFELPFDCSSDFQFWLEEYI